MAVVGRRVEAMRDGDNTVAVQTEVVLDTDTGLLLERKTVVAGVITESGHHQPVLAGQKTTVVAVQVQFTRIHGH